MSKIRGKNKLIHIAQSKHGFKKDERVFINSRNSCTIRDGAYKGYNGYIVDTDQGMACLVEDKRIKGKIIDVVILPKEMDIQIRQGFTEVLADEHFT